MSPRCRTCGKVVFCLNSRNLFQQPDNIMLHQIEALTGLFLNDQIQFPALICGPCEVALREAIGFRERIISTQKILLSSKNILEALQKFDFDEVQNLNIHEDEEDDEEEKEAELSTTYEEITDYLEDDNVDRIPEQLQPEEIPENPADEFSTNEDTFSNLETDEPVAHADAPAETARTQYMPRKPGKPPSKLYAAVNFVTNAKSAPRIDWSKLSEDEIVSLKRERRKRDCICEQCGRHFTCPSNFKVHLLRHSGIKNFSCQQCPLKFYTPHLLRRHELAHLCEKPYPCQYCRLTFADHSGRIQHERNRHTNYRPYKCTKCDKSFAVSNKLKRHMFTHSGVRSFHCEICKVSFMRSPHLAAHYRSKGHEQNVQNAHNFAELANNVDIDIEYMHS